MQLTLPFPPSTNRIWRSVCVRGRPRVLLSREGRAFRQAVREVLQGQHVQALTGRLYVRMDAHPPDNRRRDLDNLQKSILDALQQAGVYLDDSQVDDLHICRRDCRPGGVVIVNIEPCRT
jgi:crossover junction endodeoxyribonuclease RusA